MASHLHRRVPSDILPEGWRRSIIRSVSLFSLDWKVIEIKRTVIIHLKSHSDSFIQAVVLCDWKSANQEISSSPSFEIYASH